MGVVGQGALAPRLGGLERSMIGVTITVVTVVAIIMLLPALIIVERRGR